MLKSKFAFWFKVQNGTRYWYSNSRFRFSKIYFFKKQRCKTTLHYVYNQPTRRRITLHCTPSVYHIPSPLPLRKFSLTKIHFRMLRHELLHHILLFHFVRRWFAHRFLTLIKHHFFNGLPSITVQIPQF